MLQMDGWRDEEEWPPSTRDFFLQPEPQARSRSPHGQEAQRRSLEQVLESAFLGGGGGGWLGGDLHSYSYEAHLNTSRCSESSQLRGSSCVCHLFFAQSMSQALMVWKVQSSTITNSPNRMKAALPHPPLPTPPFLFRLLFGGAGVNWGFQHRRSFSSTPDSEPASPHPCALLTFVTPISRCCMPMNVSDVWS